MSPHELFRAIWDGQWLQYVLWGTVALVVLVVLRLWNLICNGPND